MTQAFDVDYLGLAPATESGVGVGLITLRAKSGSLKPLTFSFQRAALERLRDDIDNLLESGSVLSNCATMNKVQRDRVIVSPETLEKLGFNDFEYVGKQK